MADAWQKIRRRFDDTAESYEQRTRWGPKPITEMTEEELRAFIRDPYGPDYKGNIELAQFELFKRRRHE